MSDPAGLKLVQSFLTAPARGACPTSDEMAAWALFHRAHTVLIRTVLKKCGVHQSDVDDVAQQVWADVLKDLGAFEYNPAAGKLSGYIGTIAGRMARRHNRRQSEHPQTVLTKELESTLLDPAPGPLSEYECREQHDQACVIIARIRPWLADQTYRILVMRWVDGESVREIAATFGVSEDCMKKRLLRAQQSAKALLREEGVV